MSHSYVCDTPVHIVYRLRGCLPVGPLRKLSEDLQLQLKDVRRLGMVSSTMLDEQLDEYQMHYDALLDSSTGSAVVTSTLTLNVPPALAPNCRS